MKRNEAVILLLTVMALAVHGATFHSPRHKEQVASLAKTSSITLQVVQPPPPLKTNRLALQIPPNGGNTGMPEFLQVQYSDDLATWQPVTNASFQQISGTNLTINITSPAGHQFYRTSAIQDAIPPTNVPPGVIIGR